MTTELKFFPEGSMLAGSLTHHEGGTPQIFEPLVITPEISTVPQPVWTRIEKPLSAPIISAYSDSVLITLSKIPRGNQPPAIDSSIRLRFENASYILRHDFDDVCAYYEDWELIKTVPANGSSEDKSAEQVVFKRTSTRTTIVLDENITLEWQVVLENVNSLLSSLPQEYPEKEVLQKAKEYSQMV